MSDIIAADEEPLAPAPKTDQDTLIHTSNVLGLAAKVIWEWAAGLTTPPATAHRQLDACRTALDAAEGPLARVAGLVDGDGS